MLNFWGIVANILKWRSVEIFWCQESIQDVEIEQCWICAVLWQPFWKWWPVEIFRCQESIWDIIIYSHMKCHWNRTMLNLCAVLWWPFWKWWSVEICRCQESIRDIIIYPHMKWRWNRTMLNLCGIVAAILKMVTGRNFSMLGINSGHHYLPTYQILMISDNVELWWPFWKWRSVEIFQCRESIRNIIIYPHIKFWWYRTMLNFCSIVVAILKMATGRNFSMSGHHYLPTYNILMISDNVEFLPPNFYAVFWQTSWKFWKCRIAPLINGDLSLCQILCLYQYSFRSYQH